MKLFIRVSRYFFHGYDRNVLKKVQNSSKHTNKICLYKKIWNYKKKLKNQYKSIDFSLNFVLIDVHPPWVYNNEKKHVGGEKL